MLEVAEVLLLSGVPMKPTACTVPLLPGLPPIVARAYRKTSKRWLPESIILFSSLASWGGCPSLAANCQPVLISFSTQHSTLLHPTVPA